MQKYTTSTTFTAPEDGWFKFIGVAKSGEGGNSNTWTDPNGKRWRRGGGGGGAGGIAELFAVGFEPGVYTLIHAGYSLKLAVLRDFLHLTISR